MGKSTHFLGQPLYGQVIKLLDKAEILEISKDIEVVISEEKIAEDCKWDGIKGYHLRFLGY